MKTKHLLFLVILCFSGIFNSVGCTIFRLKAADGNMIVARSMEFGLDLHYDLLVVPRNRLFTSPFIAGTNGLTWHTRYGYVGVASMGLEFGVSDGMNEKGLSLSVRWYETDMQWQPVTPADSNRALASEMFSDWILGNFATVADLRMTNINPSVYPIPGKSFRPTGHGAGMIGLPGDYTPPSRFVRLGVFLRFVDQQPDAALNLNLAQHVINTFTIPFGIIVDKDPQGKIVVSESTQWVTFRDLNQRIIYFKTYDNPTLRKIDLRKIDFSAKGIRHLPMFGTQETIIEIAFN